MSEHSSFASLATRLIEKNGRDVTLRTLTDVGDDWNPVRQESDVVVKAVNVKISSHQIAAGIATADDVCYLIDSQQAVVKGQKIVDGEVFTINKVEHVKPGDQSIMYKAYASN